MNHLFLMLRIFLLLCLVSVSYPHAAVAMTRICASLMTASAPLSTEPSKNNFFLVRADEFFTAFDLNKDLHYHKNRTQAEFLLLAENGSRFFLNNDRKVGYGITGEGELISIFNASSTRGLGADAVLHAIQNGAHFLHCLEPLNSYFERFGFVVDATGVSLSLDPVRQRIWTNHGQVTPQRYRMVLKADRHIGTL